MLKIIESGLLDGLKDRWLDWKSQENEEFPFQSIDMSQMYLIFGILFAGSVIAVAILFLEGLTFSCSKLLRGNFDRNKTTKSNDVIVTVLK